MSSDEDGDSRKPPLGWILVGGVGLALVCGLGKFLMDLSEVQPLVKRRRQPWERE